MRLAGDVAVGMVPRPEVGIIVAGIGTTTGVVEPDLFAVIVGMCIATTLAAPPVLRRLLRQTDQARDRPRPREPAQPPASAPA